MNTRWNLASGIHTDVFVSADTLRERLRARGLASGSWRLTKHDLDRALVVREGLRAFAIANKGYRADEGAIAAMRRVSEGGGIEIRIEPDVPRFVAETTTGLDGAIAALSAITARAMIDRSWQRLNACPGRHCGWAFYDHSRNQAGAGAR